MEMRLPALFSISTNTVDVDLDRSSDSDSSRTMDSYDSVPQSPDAGEDDPMPLAPLNPQTCAPNGTPGSTGPLPYSITTSASDPTSADPTSADSTSADSTSTDSTSADSTSADSTSTV
ncbi:putative uncharacterized protein [Lentinula edodes]|uniref:Uncharacterized protein n=1 Tax=Lentinula edodes TaxID=5353 RepID=A0A1Q3ENB1_LENED|nr:putative uncharacterized protein [Lentinula edodes]